MLMPCSLSVGTSGSALERVSPVTARMRTLPALWCSMVSDAVSTISGTWPPIRSCAAGRAAAVSHVGERHAGRLAQQHAGEVRHRAGARGGVVGLGRVGLHPRQHRLQVARRRARPRRDGEVERGDARDRREVLDRVVAEVAVEPGRDHQRAAGRQHQRSGRPARPASVRPAPPGRRRRACCRRSRSGRATRVIFSASSRAIDVGRAAGREAHQDAHQRAVLRQRQPGRRGVAAASAANWRRFMVSPG